METVALELEQANSLPPKYKAVASVLRVGKQSATTTTDIMMLTGIKSKRDVHEIIEGLINKYGFVIGSSRKGEYKGYFYIANDEELKETLYTYNKQIQSMIDRHRNLQKNYSKLR
ncbi:hypothetical protein ACDI16_12440 [Oceanobacillus caeni]